MHILPAYFSSSCLVQASHTGFLSFSKVHPALSGPRDFAVTLLLLGMLLMKLVLPILHDLTHFNFSRRFFIKSLSIVVISDILNYGTFSFSLQQLFAVIILLIIVII